MQGRLLSPYWRASVCPIAAKALFHAPRYGYRGVLTIVENQKQPRSPLVRNRENKASSADESLPHPPQVAVSDAGLRELSLAA